MKRAGKNDWSWGYTKPPGLTNERMKGKSPVFGSDYNGLDRQVEAPRPFADQTYTVQWESDADVEEMRQFLRESWPQVRTWKNEDAKFRKHQLNLQQVPKRSVHNRVRR